MPPPFEEDLQFMQYHSRLSQLSTGKPGSLRGGPSMNLNALGYGHPHTELTPSFDNPRHTKNQLQKGSKNGSDTKAVWLTFAHLKLHSLSFSMDNDLRTNFVHGKGTSLSRVGPYRFYSGGYRLSVLRWPHDPLSTSLAIPELVWYSNASYGNLVHEILAGSCLSWSNGSYGRS